MCLVLLSLAVVVSHAQCAFVKSRSEVMQRASRQWMIREAEVSSPDLFRVPSVRIAPSEWQSEVPAPDDALLQHFHEIYMPGGDTKRAGAIRALCDLYFPLFQKILDRQQLPSEYIWLPVALTGLNQSYQDSGGNTGLWAMDYFAARRRGMRADQFVDERRGGDFTAEQAVAMLAEWHHRYSGDRNKAMLAWIYSPAYVASPAVACEGFPGCASEEALQTLQFIEFTRILFQKMAAPNRIGVFFDAMGNQESVFFTRPVTFAALQATLGADDVLLHEWNPVYIGEEIDPAFRKVPFQLTIAQAAAFRTKEDSVYTWKPALPPVSLVTEVEEKYTHRVKKGETLGTIAAKHHVRVSQLKKWNRLRSDRIRAGQVLVLYRTVKRTVAQDVAEPAPPQAEETTETNETTAPEEERPKPAPKPPAVIIHRVKSGETLWSIAKKYPGVTPALIMEWNNCSERIQAGQKLKIRTDLR
jgi:membrane-bound lytic murein transglycosylase D